MSTLAIVLHNKIHHKGFFFFYLKSDCKPCKVLIYFCFALIADGPKITCRDNQSVMENVPFILSCNVTGFPRPDLTFYKDGEEVELRDKLTRRDGGFYNIFASNSLQRVKSQINITVVCESLFFPVSLLCPAGRLSSSYLTC